KAAYGLARGPVREVSAAGEPANGKVKPGLPFEAAMPQEISVDDALGKIEAQARHEIIFELFPDELSIDFFVFHGWGSRRRFDPSISRDKQSAVESSRQRKACSCLCVLRVKSLRRPQRPRESRPAD